MNTFDPAGPTAQSEKDVLIVPLAIAGFVFVLVEGGIVFLAIKFRHRKNQRADAQAAARQHAAGDRLDDRAGGVARDRDRAGHLADLEARPIPPDAMQITVQGYQWWWGFQYLDQDMQVDYGEHGPITVADVLVIPTNRRSTCSSRRRAAARTTTRTTRTTR